MEGICRNGSRTLDERPLLWPPIHWKDWTGFVGRTEIVLWRVLSSVAGQKPSATAAEPVKKLHELLYVDWPCPLEEGFNEAWRDLGRDMASSGLRSAKDMMLM